MINQHGARERRGLTAQEWYFVPRVCSSRRAQHQCDRCHLEFVRHDVFFVDAAKSTLEVCGDVGSRPKTPSQLCVAPAMCWPGIYDSLAVCWNTASPRSMFFAWAGRGALSGLSGDGGTSARDDQGFGEPPRVVTRTGACHCKWYVDQGLDGQQVAAFASGNIADGCLFLPLVCRENSAGSNHDDLFCLHVNCSPLPTLAHFVPPY